MYEDVYRTEQLLFCMDVACHITNNREIMILNGVTSFMGVPVSVCWYIYR